ncbi:6283_t:CDS:2 [Paraglomus brasilianum]|uniref:6283_t:CDS:1 n=1 Tax=Paraglomus brasilianum TaxID=144538 RepID=A0A9N9D238_9GLOM|nr:6283_t:CDS:2 [Paraglomus brasilianum]
MGGLTPLMAKTLKRKGQIAGNDTEPEWQGGNEVPETDSDSSYITDCQTETKTTVSITSLLEDYYKPGTPQGKTKKASKLKRLGEYIYDDEDGWIFRTYDQRHGGTEIPEEEVFWASPEERKEEAEKYKKRYQYEAEWYEEQNRRFQGYNYNGPSGYQIAGNYVPNDVRLFNKRELTSDHGGRIEDEVDFDSWLDENFLALDMLRNK